MYSITSIPRRERGLFYVPTYGLISKRRVRTTCINSVTDIRSGDYRTGNLIKSTLL